jgi:PAS domain S-box-containing protein
MSGDRLAAQLPFLSGDGDMGARIREHDWTATPLGPPERWPLPLRVALSICLHSSFPTAIYWGPELRLLYNDAWSPILSEKHPWALGRAASEVWPDIWHIVGPQFDEVMGSGRGFSAFDQMLPMERGGRSVETYWNYSFTPILDEAGRVVGVFNQGNETTAVILSGREREAETGRLREMFKQAPSAIALLRGPEHVFDIANDAYLQLIGRRNVIGLKVAEALPEVVAQGFIDLLDRVYRSGEPYVGKSVPVTLDLGGAPDHRLLDFIYQPVRDSSGRIGGIFVEATDVTEQRRTETAIRESEQRFRLIAESAPVMLWMGDRAGKCVYLNKALREFWGVTLDDVATFDWNTTLHPDDRGKLFGPFSQAMHTHAPLTVEARYRRTDGEFRTVHTQAQPRFGAGGEFLGMIGVNTDVTETRSAEARRNALIELTDRVRDLTDPADIAYAASEILGRTLDVSRAGYGTIDRAAETITIERDWNAPGIKSLAGVLHFRDYGSYIDDLKRGETVVFANAEKDPRTAANAGALKAISAQAVVNMPVTEQGNFVALLYLNHAAARDWPPDEIAFIRDFAERTRAIVERRRAEQDLEEFTASLERTIQERTAELRANITRLRTTFESSYIYQGYLTPDGTLLDANAASLAGIDARLEDVVGKPFWETPWFSGTPGMPEAVRQAVRAAAHGQTLQQSIVITLPAGERSFEFALRPVKSDQGEVIAIVPEAVETTERVKAESALRQAQKMEAIGQLTGGIAHDFNNMLAVVIGAINLLQRRLAQGNTDVRRYIDGALEGANRAASLTQRLLAFSRQQALAPEPISANRMVAGMSELLSRTLGEHIRIETVLAAGLWQTFADPVQLESAILNLSVNARDAMPDGGKLTIETANAYVDESFAREFQIAPGQYVMTAVTDTGTGMTPDVIAKAFDPFFTTKKVGAGTGLGLSQVFGFVRQSGGHVKIYSEPGVGTTVKIYLPRYQGSAVPAAPKQDPATPPRGDPGEVVLVVEDDERVRGYSVEALREFGYTVVQAANGAEALRMIDSGQTATLLFTDVVMPEMTGRQLADQARRKLPGLKVLFTTGYTRNAVTHNGMLETGTNFLPKPFGLEQLAAKVRSVLDG